MPATRSTLLPTLWKRRSDFIPPLLLHSVSRGQSALYQSETYVFHMNFLGGNATDICSTRYLMPLTNEELSVPCLIRPTHPAYVSLRKILHRSVLSLQIRLRDTNWPLRHYCCRLFSCSCRTVPRTGNDLSTPQTPLKIKTVLDYIHLHYAEPLTVAGLAAQCYFSEYYFMRFSKNT